MTKRGKKRFFSWVLVLVMALTCVDGLMPALKAQAAAKYVISAYVVSNEMGYTTGSGTYNHGDTVTLWAYPADGYDFAGWADYAGNTGSYENPYVFEATQSRDIEAVFKKKGEYFIYLPSHEEGTVNVSPLKDSYKPGETVQLSKSVNSNYVFDTFLYKEEGQEEYVPIGNSFVMPNNDVWISAKFRSTLPYSVTLNGNGQHGTVTFQQGNGTFYEGDQVKINAIPDEGYQLTELSGLPADYVFEDNLLLFTMPRRNLTISATFTETKTFQLSATPPDGGSVSYEKTDQGYITISATPNDGFAFKGWYDYSSPQNKVLLDTNPTYTFKWDRSMNILAVFVRKGTISLIMNPSGSGTVQYELDKSTYEFTLTAVPNQGYAFQKWINTDTQEVLSTESVYKVTPDGDIKITACFVLQGSFHRVYNTFQLTNGKIELDQTAYEAGKEVEVRAVPDAGYVVEKFYYGTYADGKFRPEGYVENNKFVMPDHDVYVYATFIKGCTVSASASSEGGTVTGGGTFKSGSTVTLTAAANEYYEFVNWTENGNVVSTSATYEFTVTTDRDLIANFKEIEVIYEGEFFENFETPESLRGWKFYDEDGDEYNWYWGENEFSYYMPWSDIVDLSGLHALYSASQDVDAIKPLRPDNWAITPAIVVPKNATMLFGVRTYSTTEDRISVYVGKSPSVEDMELILTFDPSTRYLPILIDLNAYAGEKIYIGFRHHDSFGGSLLIIDNIEVCGDSLSPDFVADFKHNVEFDNNIAMHYVIPKSQLAGYSNIQLVIDKNVYEKSEEAPSVATYVLENPTTYEMGGVEYWHFVFPGIAASEMGNKLCAQIVCQEGDQILKSQLDIYSVKQYAYDRLEKTTKDTYRTLLVDMLNYGAAAQIHFEKNASSANLVNKDLTPLQQSYATPESEFVLNSVENLIPMNGTPQAYFDGKNLVYDTNVVLAYRMDFSELLGNKTVNAILEAIKMRDVKIVFTYNNGKGEKTLTVPYSKFTKKNNNMYVAYCDCLTPAEMGCTVNATIYDGYVQISDTLQYSIETYVKSRYGASQSESYKDLMKKMVLYGRTVKTHFSK